jgi:hypothetical protein
MAFAIPGNPGSRDYYGPVSAGLYLDRSPIFTPKGALQDALNVRIRRGAITNEKIGWSSFHGIQLWGEVTLVDSFAHVGGNTTVFGDRGWLYRFDPGLLKAMVLNPNYVAGTASAAGTAVTGIGTLWNTGADASHAGWQRAIAPGDKIHFGLADQYDKTALWYDIQAVNSDTSLTLTTSAGAVGAGAYTIIKKFSGIAGEVWQWVLFPRRDSDGKDLFYATNASELVRWDVVSTSECVVLSLGFVPRHLAIHDRIVVASDILQAGTRTPGKVRTSAIGEPEDFVNNEAAELFVTDGQEEIWAARPLGEFLAFYCDRSVRAGRFVGPPSFWDFKTILPGVGIQGRNAIMDYGMRHEFLAKDTIYSFDGVQNLNIAPHVAREKLRSLDYARRFQCLAVLDQERGEVSWVIPNVTDVGATPETALLEHYLELAKLPPFTQRQLPATAAGYYVAEQSKRFSDFPSTTFAQMGGARFDDRSFGGSYPTVLFGDKNGNIYELNVGQTANGVVIDCYAEFACRPTLETGSYGALIQRIEPVVTNQSSSPDDLYVELLGYDRVGGPAILLASLPYKISGEGKRFVSPRKHARYAAVRFRTSIDTSWELHAWAWNMVRGSGR